MLLLPDIPTAFCPIGNAVPETTNTLFDDTGNLNCSSIRELGTSDFYSHCLFYGTV